MKTSRTAATIIGLLDVGVIGTTAGAAHAAPPPPPARAAAGPGCSAPASGTTTSTTTPVSAPVSVAGVTVTISGGHQTDARDNGRPVVLIAAALGVPTEVFRTALSGVTPAENGQ